MVPEKWSPEKKIPEKNGLRKRFPENWSLEKWSPENWSSGNSETTNRGVAVENRDVWVKCWDVINL